MVGTIFNILAIIGVVIISIFAFAIPNNPFYIIKGVNYDYPLWLCLIVVGVILYFIILHLIYVFILKIKEYKIR